MGYHLLDGHSLARLAVTTLVDDAVAGEGMCHRRQEEEVARGRRMSKSMNLLCVCVAERRFEYNSRSLAELLGALILVVGGAAAGATIVVG